MFYKIQKFNSVSLSWVDVQRRYTSLDAARVAQTKYTARTRIMCIDGKKRYIVTASV